MGSQKVPRSGGFIRPRGGVLYEKGGNKSEPIKGMFPRRKIRSYSTKREQWVGKQPPERKGIFRKKRMIPDGQRLTYPPKGILLES